MPRKKLNGTVVSPGTLVDWLDRSWIERVVFDGPSRVTTWE